jgi:hypothetical protein
VRPSCGLGRIDHRQKEDAMADLVSAYGGGTPCA